MTSPAAAPRPADAGPLSHREIVTILTGLMMGMFLAALDQTIVATSIRTVADDLRGLDMQAWVTTAYLITSTITTPLYGKLSDIYGRKPLFVTAITVFVAGSALCGLATSMWQLAGFRAVQGLGAGGLFALALAIIGDIVPPRERARYQGYFLAVFGTSSVLGPVVGGFLAGQDTLLGVTGWRWVFLVNVPVGAAALLVVMRTLHVPHHRHDHRIDWPGALALVTTLVPLLTVAEQGRTWGWTSAPALACYAIGLVGLVLFVLAERAYGEEALLPLRLFTNRTFSVSGGVGVILGMGMFGGLACIPLYLQLVKGATPTEAGLLMLPFTAGIMVGSIVSGQLISRTGRYRVFPVVGLGLLVLAMLAFSRVSADTPTWAVMVPMVVFGLGLGGNMQPLVLAVQNAVSPRDIGVATSSATFFRQMGGTLGTAVFLSVLFSTAADKIASAFDAAASDPAFQAATRDPAVLADPTNRDFVERLQAAAAGGGAEGGAASPAAEALKDSSFIGRLDPRLADPFKTGFAESMDLVFLLGAAVLLLGFLLIWLLPELPLRTRSPLEEAAADRAAAAVAAADAEADAASGSDGDEAADAQAGRAEAEHPAGRLAP